MNQQENIPTVFLGGRKAVLDRMGINSNWKSIVKMAIAAVLLFVCMVLILTRDWAMLFRESAVSSERVAKVEAAQLEIKQDFVRKDVLEPRLTSLEKNAADTREDIQQIRASQEETNKLLRLLVAQKYKGG